MSPTPPRRIVTGHDATGRSVVLSDGTTPTTHVFPTGAILHEIWSTPDAPARTTVSCPRPRSHIVLDGEIHLELDDGTETRLVTGDVVVQRGTAHGWSNRSENVTRMLFVMVDGGFTDELRSTLGDEALAQLLQ